MANHDYLLIYGKEIEDSLRSDGCTVPTARPGNRYPTMQEVIAAVEAEGLQVDLEGEYVMVLPPPDAPHIVKSMTRLLTFVDASDRQILESAERPPMRYLVEVHSYHWDELNVDATASITMRGNFPLELFIVRKLAERCGQLVLYPDTGDPPVVVEADQDAGQMASAWLETIETGDPWAKFYERISSSPSV